MSRNREPNVDCSGIGRNVWLVKVPKYLSGMWSKADSSGFVGSLVISKNSNAQVMFKLSENLAKEEQKSGTNVPRDHDLKMSDFSQSLLVFSEMPVEDDSGGASSSKFAMEGKVVKRADCRPREDAEYHSMKRKAIAEAIQPKRRVKQLTEPVGNSFKPVADHINPFAPKSKSKDEGKRARADRDKVLEVLFSAFEDHQYYSLKDLVQITDQPVLHLKNILKDICNYNTKNPHKNMWELKPEYRHYKSEEDKQ